MASSAVSSLLFCIIFSMVSPVGTRLMGGRYGVLFAKGHMHDGIHRNLVAAQCVACHLALVHDADPIGHHGYLFEIG